MKKTAIFLSVIFLLSSCISSKDISSRAENRKLKKMAEQAEIKKAVESRKYVIMVDKLYVFSGGIIDTQPRNNFIIVNDDIASISLPYIGRSFGRPITGINLNSRASFYKMENKGNNGLYEIKMEVKYASDNFDIYITIGNNGYCNVSINNAYIQPVSYSGTLLPLEKSRITTIEKGERI